MTMSSYYFCAKSFGVNVSPPPTPVWKKVPPEQTAPSHSPLKSDAFFSGNLAKMGIDPNSLRKMCPVDRPGHLGEEEALDFLKTAIIHKTKRKLGAVAAAKQIVKEVIEGRHFTPAQQAEAWEIYIYAAKHPCNQPLTNVPQQTGNASSPKGKKREMTPPTEKQVPNVKKITEGLLEIQSLIAEAQSKIRADIQAGNLSNEVLQANKALLQAVQMDVDAVELKFPILKKDWDARYESLNQSWKTRKTTNPGIKTVDEHLQVIKFVIEHLQFSTELETDVQLSRERAQKLSRDQAKIIKSVREYIQAVEYAPDVQLSREQTKNIAFLKDYIQAFQDAMVRPT